MSNDPRKAANRRQIIGAAVTLAVMALIAAAAFVAAKSLERTPGPSSEQLFAKLSQARADSFAFHIDATLTAKGDLQGPSAELFGSGASIELEGQSSLDSFQAKGTIEGGSAAPQSFEVRFTGGGFYINTGEGWYGERELGPAAQAGAGVDFSAAKKLAAIFSPRSYGGPEIDGQSTWQISGVPPDAAVIPVFNWEKVRDAISYELTLGAADYLPRQLRLAVVGDPASWMLVPLAEDQAPPVSEIDFEMTMTFADWGEPVVVSAPTGAKSLAKIFQLPSGLSLTPPGS